MNDCSFGSTDQNGLTDLQNFQIQEQRYFLEQKQKLEAVAKKDLRQKECEKHFDKVFIPTLYMLSFEQFCVLLVRAYSRTCGQCAIYYDARTKDVDEKKDPLFDFCPHLVCTEWSFLPKMRSIGKLFWQRFLQTRVGKEVKFCFSPCYNCYWTNLFGVGASEKRHVCLQKIELSTCLCFSNKMAQDLKNWCCKVFGDKNRVVIYKCKCHQKNKMLKIH